MVDVVCQAHHAGVWEPITREGRKVKCLTRATTGSLTTRAIAIGSLRIEARYASVPSNGKRCAWHHVLAPNREMPVTSHQPDATAELRTALGRVQVLALQIGIDHRTNLKSRAIFNIAREALRRDYQRRQEARCNTT